MPSADIVELLRWVSSKLPQDVLSEGFLQLSFRAAFGKPIGVAVVSERLRQVHVEH